MAKFIVRVELHTAGARDYDVLHEAMQQSGFRRDIMGSNGIQYDLPTAEYYLMGEYTAEAVREAARLAAVSTGKAVAVLVTQGTRLVWTGLQPSAVQPKPAAAKPKAAPKG